MLNSAVKLFQINDIRLFGEVSNNNVGVLDFSHDILSLSRVMNKLMKIKLIINSKLLLSKLDRGCRTFRPSNHLSTIRFQIGDNVKIINSVILDGVVIGRNSTLTGSLALEEATIGDGVDVKDSLVGVGVLVESGSKAANETLVKNMMEI